MNSCIAQVKILFTLDGKVKYLTLFLSESKEELRLWIVDPKHMSDAEKNGTALFPSQVGSFVNK